MKKIKAVKHGGAGEKSNPSSARISPVAPVGKKGFST